MYSYFSVVTYHLQFIYVRIFISYTNHVAYIYSLMERFGLHKVVGSTISNTWLFHFILVCVTVLCMYIWYDDEIYFIRIDTCFRSTNLLITNIMCTIILVLQHSIYSSHAYVYSRCTRTMLFTFIYQYILYTISIIHKSKMK